MIGLRKEQVLACMGVPASKAAEGVTEVWSYNAVTGTFGCVGLLHAILYSKSALLTGRQQSARGTNIIYPVNYPAGKLDTRSHATGPRTTAEPTKGNHGLPNQRLFPPDSRHEGHKENSMKQPRSHRLSTDSKKYPGCSVIFQANSRLSIGKVATKANLLTHSKLLLCVFCRLIF
jgi:hypothetical protein